MQKLADLEYSYFSLASRNVPLKLRMVYYMALAFSISQFIHWIRWVLN